MYNSISVYHSDRSSKADGVHLFTGFECVGGIGIEETIPVHTRSNSSDKNYITFFINNFSGELKYIRINNSEIPVYRYDICQEKYVSLGKQTWKKAYVSIEFDDRCAYIIGDPIVYTDLDNRNNYYTVSGYKKMVGNGKITGIAKGQTGQTYVELPFLENVDTLNLDGTVLVMPRNAVATAVGILRHMADGSVKLEVNITNNSPSTCDISFGYVVEGYFSY
jgi:hypothetical protein